MTDRVDYSDRARAERVAALEERVKNLKEDVAEIKLVVTDIHAIILKSKGAKWAIIALATTLSTVIGLIGTYLHKVIPFFRS